MVCHNEVKVHVTGDLENPQNVSHMSDGDINFRTASWKPR